MLRSQIPAKMGIQFASGAGPTFIQNPLPVPPQAGGRASFTQGFSDLNFDPLAAGGIPPWGKDFNGLFFAITDWLRFTAAGGIPVSYDSTFQATIGGYPQYALLLAATGDRYWLSTVDNNLTNPDTGGAGWQRFPDVIVQKQAGNYALDIGGVNTYRVTLNPLPASLASIVGSPIRVRAANPNTIINPTILIDNVAGDLALPMINSNGSPLLVGQIARTNQIFEGFVDGLGFFQVTTPAPIVGFTPTSAAITGVVYKWTAEVPPSWGLECNGAQYPISSYPNLFNVIQNRWTTTGDGVNTFNVPDLRGAFIRGWDHGRGLDPNATTRTKSPFPSSSTVIGDHIGSWEGSTVRAADLQGARVLLTGDPTRQQTPFSPAPIFDPIIGQTVYALSTKHDKNIGPSDVWETWTIPNFGIPLQGNLGSGAQGFDSFKIYELAALLTQITGGFPETRPLNANLMFVIAY